MGSLIQSRVGGVTRRGVFFFQRSGSERAKFFLAAGNYNLMEFHATPFSSRDLRRLICELYYINDLYL